MGKASRVVTSENAQSASALRRSRGFLKVATPALALSAAVFFSANVHAKGVPEEARKSIVSEGESFKARYADIQKSRAMTSEVRNVVAGAAKALREARDMMGELHAQEDADIATRDALDKVGHAIETAKAHYEKRSGERDFIAFEDLTHEQFAGQAEFREVLETAQRDPAVAEHIDFGSARETMTSIKVSQARLDDRLASRSALLSKVDEHAAEHANTILKFATNPSYLEAEAENLLSPRGIGAEANVEGAWASGDLAKAIGENSTAFGVGAHAEGKHATAIGHQAKALQDAATAIGSHATAVKDATAIGANARATAKGAVAIGEGVVNTEENTVQFAKDGETKRLKNVAEGTADTDATNVKQLRDSATTVTTTLRDEINLSRQTSVREAVTQSSHYTDQKVGEIRKDMAAMDKTFRQGIASAAALMMPAPYAPGKVAVTAGTALYRGTGAAAIGVSYWNQNGTWNINAGVSTAGGKSTIVRLGGSMLF